MQLIIHQLHLIVTIKEHHISFGPHKAMPLSMKINLM